ncbi:putative vesicular transport protein [Encephalitozoon romaleae SJ-2008]|uniref:Vesicular transport protein n=1 Tax=Encephalitozoon romaleae (strain SJ-2008) TaxID=1178016 RepID=I7AFC8_ENCRO|nr:putative vesicular transport protein [Encephalitozoon romaleae SJ-2008]AFN83405.1 putative vesicular transport protein [Encephalitozoon romaleae SJ-2008]
MAEKDVPSLIEEENAIRKELKVCEEDLENIGALAIRIQSFSRSVSNLDPSEPEAERLSKQADLFSKSILRLGNQRSKKRSEMREEMTKSKANTEKEYMENTNIPQPISDDDFFSSSTKRINDVLMNAMDAFETVKRQNVYINRTSERIRASLSQIGLSKQLIDQIDKRYLSDRVLFMGGIVLLVIMFFLLRFFL